MQANAFERLGAHDHLPAPQRSTARRLMWMREHDAKRRPLPHTACNRDVAAPAYDEAVHAQIEEVKAKKPAHTLGEYLRTGDTWEIK